MQKFILRFGNILSESNEARKNDKTCNGISNTSIYKVTHLDSGKIKTQSHLSSKWSNSNLLHICGHNIK